MRHTRETARASLEDAGFKVLGEDRGVSAFQIILDHGVQVDVHDSGMVSVHGKQSEFTASACRALGMAGLQQEHEILFMARSLRDRADLMEQALKWIASGKEPNPIAHARAILQKARVDTRSETGLREGVSQ